MTERFMLETFGGTPAAEPVLQSKVRDFADVLGLPMRPMDRRRIVRAYHITRRLQPLYWFPRRILHPNRSGLLVLFNFIHLKDHASFFMTSGGDHALVLMDVWPQNYHYIAEWMPLFGIFDVFVSSSQAARELNALQPRVRWHWLPEGLPTDDYRPYKWAEKSIDVLSFGRKHNDLHAVLIDGLPTAGIGYQYEPQPYDVLFPTHDEFLEGLGRAKISICFPSSVTHPKRSQYIETLTVRYLQSMASRCLILGQAPAELVELFGYNPVVPIDWADPIHQIRGLLEDPSSLELVEKNLQTVLSAHTEKHRAVDLARLKGWTLPNLQ